MMFLFLARFIATLIHIALVVALAPLLSGLVAKLHARLLGQRGPAIVQPYRNLVHLLAKTALLPEIATDLFPLWPFACFAVLAVAAMLAPGFCTGLLTAPLSGFITIIFLLALARAILLLAALETGFGPAAAAASRQIIFSLFAEAALLTALLTLALLTHSATLDGIATAFRTTPPGLSVALGFSLLAMLAVALAENAEQEVMLTEYSGRYLALFQLAAMLRLMIWMCILGSIFAPFGMARAANIFSWPGGLLLWLAKLCVMAFGLALFQAATVKMQSFRIPQLLGMASVLGAIAAVFLLIARTGG